MIEGRLEVPAISQKPFLEEALERLPVALDFHPVGINATATEGDEPVKYERHKYQEASRRFWRCAMAVRSS